MGALRLIRAIVDSLQDINDLDSLVLHYNKIDFNYVTPIAKTFDLPQLAVLDYGLALSAAFYLRSQEILKYCTQVEIENLVKKARKNGEEWVVIYDQKNERGGYSFFQRLEMHLPDGISLSFASELDWEKGHIFTLEPLLLDSKTGRIIKNSKPLDPRKEFSTKKELMAEVVRLRAKYSNQD